MGLSKKRECLEKVLKCVNVLSSHSLRLAGVQGRKGERGVNRTKYLFSKVVPITAPPFRVIGISKRPGTRL